MKLSNEKQVQVYDYLRSISGIGVGDCDAFLSGRSDLKSVLTEEEHAELMRIVNSTGKV
jgi:hypothetical protein